MKQFFKSVAATVVGIFVFGIFMSVLGFVCLVGMLVSTSSQPTLEDNTVMVMKLKGEIVDHAEDNVIGQLTGAPIGKLGMDKILSAIKKAKKEKKIKGIYIEADDVSTDYATLLEIRNALADFKKSGKWVVAYGDSYSQGGYYLASVANKVYLNPSGMIDWHGLASQPMFIKDVAAKLGVHFTIVKVGKYKSFTEMYTEDRMTDANREQVTRYINGTWQQILSAVAQSRNLSKDLLNRYADGLMAFEDPKELKSKKLVDGFCYYDEIRQVVKKQLGIASDESINQASIEDVNSTVDDENYAQDEIAVYYCQGDIVSAPSTSLVGAGDQIVSKDVIHDLEELGEDDDVKAVVLRINSGGGDAYASEQLWRAVSQLKKKKPVVVSMGGATASGAYYMSMGASYLMAQPTTLTGSIGIFGALPDLSELTTKKLGFKYDEVKTNRNSGYAAAGLSRPWSTEELTYLQANVNRGYQLFRQRVADGRKMTTEQVEKIAQGRVWLGTDAKAIRLVDGLGGLEDAIQKAALLAKTKDYYTVDYPTAGNWMDQLLDEVSDSEGTYLDEQLRLTLGELYKPFMTIRNMKEQKPIQASLPYFMNIH